MNIYTKMNPKKIIFNNPSNLDDKENRILMMNLQLNTKIYIRKSETTENSKIQLIR